MTKDSGLGTFGRRGKEEVSQPASVAEPRKLEKRVALSVRFTDEQYRRVAELGAETRKPGSARVSIQTLILDGLDALFEKHGLPPLPR
jgi:hypothetical protein